MYVSQLSCEREQMMVVTYGRGGCQARDQCSSSLSAFVTKPGILAKTWSFPNPDQVCFVPKTEQTLKCYMIQI